MGYSSGYACFPTQNAAALDWCARLDSGAYAASCTGCAGSSCEISLLNSSGSFVLTSKIVGQVACDVPDPVGDASLFTGATIALWVSVAAAMYVVRLFRSPHVDPD